MSFAVGADAYDRFMGRYSMPLAPTFADLAAVDGGQRVLDVGCGPGALTAELAERVGPKAVAAVDPAGQFVAALRERHPGVEVQRAAAEQLPFDDGTFDATLAQLVVHFMAQPVTGLREMARVTRRDGVVAACVWDHAGGGGPLSVFWEAVHELDADAADESQLPGAREGHLGQLFREAGCCARSRRACCRSTSSIRRSRSGGRPTRSASGRQACTSPGSSQIGRPSSVERCRELLPEAPFVVSARAWAARGLA